MADNVIRVFLSRPVVTVSTLAGGRTSFEFEGYYGRLGSLNGL